MTDLRDYVLARKMLNLTIELMAKQDLHPFAVYCALAATIESFIEVNEKNPYAKGDLREDLIQKLRTGDFPGEENENDDPTEVE